MNRKKALKLYNILKAALSVLVILIAAAVITSTVAIYRSSTESPYSAQSILNAVSKSKIMWLLVIFIVLLLVMSAFRLIIVNGKGENANDDIPMGKPYIDINYKKIKIIRICVLVSALLLIMLGIYNGGIKDVLFKAINICTECIGLG